MKYIVFFLGILLFSTQVDYYDMDLGNNTITVEVEENNSLLEEYISYDNTSHVLLTATYFRLKIFKPYLLSFDQIHPDQDLDPPDVLS